MTLQEFTDPQPVDVTIGLRPPEAITVPRSGTVTMWNCSPGGLLESGTSSVAVDGANLITMSTTVPMWRDIIVGAEGADVAAVQAELSRLGYAAHADSVFSTVDWDSTVSLWESAGIELHGEVVPRESLLWIPAPTVNIEKCEVGLGGSVAGGQTLVQVNSDLQVSPVTLPAGRMPGERVLEAFGDPLPLGSDGELPSNFNSDLIRASPEFREATAGASDMSTVTIKGKALLAEPVEVAAVPATSVMVVDSEHACVFSGKSTFRVKVVGSEFGNSFVAFEGPEVPTSVSSLVPTRRTTCD